VAERIVTILPDAAALAGATADHFVALVEAALRKKDAAHVALAGGSTPRAVTDFFLLGNDPLSADDVEWKPLIRANSPTARLTSSRS
jgi:6-phosphogluconolactonase/glucosamine-6-phosphate isomerase/deaminase